MALQALEVRWHVERLLELGKRPVSDVALNFDLQVAETVMKTAVEFYSAQRYRILRFMD